MRRSNNLLFVTIVESPSPQSTDLGDFLFLICRFSDIKGNLTIEHLKFDLTFLDVHVLDYRLDLTLLVLTKLYSRTVIATASTFF